MTRERLVLAVVLLILVISSVWGIYSYPRQKTVTDLKYCPGQRNVADRKRPPLRQEVVNVSDQDRLRIDRLKERYPPFSGYRRNIFRPIFEDREAMMARKAAEEAARAATAAKKALLQQRLIKPKPQPSWIQHELASFTVKGFVTKSGRKMVFLGKGSEVFVLKEGDTFAGLYTVVSLTEQILIFRATNTGEEFVIPVYVARSGS